MRLRTALAVCAASAMALTTVGAVADLPANASATYTETTGGVTNTWSNYSNAGGSEGQQIPAHATVQVACVVPGFKVADGDTWWYEIASSPWNGAYFASADAFYNNGATSGSLSGTPFVDPAVPACTNSAGGAGSGGSSGGSGGSSGGSAPYSCAGPADSGHKYSGWAACEWATHNVYTPPSFPADDCTWFVSQALWQGGMSQTSDWTGKSYDWSKQASKKHYPGPTVDAADAPDLVQYLLATHQATQTRITWSDNTAGGARIGDLIAYHWNPAGHDPSSTTIDHLAMVTGFSGTYPLVSQHTEPRLNRGWSWDPNKNNWIQYADPGSIAWLIHITA
ncbi:MAG TPA: amidase domain-containing protein [Mycobacteriales bacterium]|nr:amidase domain-containing protein [Mycobacteriales bacterium]